MELKDDDFKGVNFKDKVVLLVEDNPDDANLAFMAFQRNAINCRLVHVNNGVEALDYLFAKGQYASRSLAEMPHLVLLDINMPKMNGLEALERIRENKLTKRLPVVMLTSSKIEQDIEKSYDKGANAYVVKPSQYKEFCALLQHLGFFWLIANETSPKDAP